MNKQEIRKALTAARICVHEKDNCPYNCPLFDDPICSVTIRKAIDQVMKGFICSDCLDEIKAVMEERKILYQDV